MVGRWIVVFPHIYPEIHYQQGGFIFTDLYYQAPPTQIAPMYKQVLHTYMGGVWARLYATFWNKFLLMKTKMLKHYVLKLTCFQMSYDSYLRYCGLELVGYMSVHTWQSSRGNHSWVPATPRTALLPGSLLETSPRHCLQGGERDYNQKLSIWLNGVGWKYIAIPRITLSWRQKNASIPISK